MSGSIAGEEVVVDSLSGSDGEEEYEVEKIIKMKRDKKGVQLFLVHWKNYGTDEDSWEPRENLQGATEILDEFLKLHKNEGKGTSSSKKRPKVSSASKKNNKKSRKNEDSDVDNETGKVKDQSSGNESESEDESFTPASGNKKKNTEKKSKKGASSSSAQKSADSTIVKPHSQDSLTIAMNRRKNYGNHSSWLESDDNESDGGDENGKQDQKEGEEANVENGNTEGSNDTPVTDKIGNNEMESPPVDPDASNTNTGINDSIEPIEPSEHDPPPIENSILMNGTEENDSNKDTPPPRSTRFSKERAMQAMVDQQPKKDKGKATTKGREQASTSVRRGGESKGVLKYAGAYRADDGQLRFVAKHSDSGETVSLTYNEAANQDLKGLSDFLYGKVRFESDGTLGVVVPRKLRDDGKLSFE